MLVHPSTAVPIPARMDLPKAISGVEHVHAVQDPLRERCGSCERVAGQKGDVLHYGPRSV